jgi:hypothetical protein
VTQSLSTKTRDLQYGPGLRGNYSSFTTCVAVIFLSQFSVQTVPPIAWNMALRRSLLASGHRWRVPRKLRAAIPYVLLPSCIPLTSSHASPPYKSLEMPTSLALVGKDVYAASRWAPSRVRMTAETEVGPTGRQTVPVIPQEWRCFPRSTVPRQRRVSSLPFAPEQAHKI